MKEAWDTKKIGDVCSLMTGGTPSKSKPEYFNGDIPWLVSGDIHQGEIFECEGRISETGMKNSNAKMLPVNSVMIALNGQGKTRGTVAILRLRATCNQSLVCIHPKEPEKLLPEYLYANLHGRYQEIRQMTGDSGNDRRGLNMELIKSIEIPIAPISEQKRIVAILDEAFDGIAAAKANAEKNLQNARALFESHLQSVFSNGSKGTIRTTVGEQLTLQRGFDITKGEQYPGSIPVVSSGGIKSFHDKPMASGPGVVIGRKGTLGKVFYLETDFWPHDTTLYVKDFKENNPKLVYYFFAGLDVKHLDSGTANPALNRNLVHPLVVNWPSISNQQSIVEKLDALHAETQLLESLYQRKLTALDELKKSLLHQAFSGAL